MKKWLLFAVALGGITGCSSGSSTPPPAPDGLVAVTLRGTITAAPYVAVDSSVNDPHAPFTSNRQFDEAQIIANPVLLGGYVTLEPTGVAGDRFAEKEDRFDTFMVPLAAGQRATLQVSDFSEGQNEMALLLRDHEQLGEDNLPLVWDSSFHDGGGMLQVTAPRDGTYFLDLQAIAGASKYVLTVGSMPSLLEMGYPEPFKPHLEMVPGEAIVTLHEKKLTPTETGPAARTASGSPGDDLGMRRAGGGPGRENLLRRDDLWQVGVLQQRLKQKPPQILPQNPMDELRAVRIETLRLVRALTRHPAVARATPNYLYHLQMLPNDPHYERQWHYPQINLPAAWASTTGHPDTVVAVVDSGVFLAHPDLAANLTTNGSDGGDGWNFVNCSSEPECANPDDPGDGFIPGSKTWHGTHIAGTVGAIGNNSLGVTGVAWNISLMPVRVCGQGGNCTSYAIIQGVRYAAGLENDSGRVPQRPADVINLSLGGSPYTAAEQELYRKICEEKEIIVVAAAGNSGSSMPFYPAAYECVLSVAALALSDRAPYSNYGATVDLAAPGGNLATNDWSEGILSTWVEDLGGSRQPAYAFMEGTSMAASHVAGVMALMRTLNPAITPRQIRDWLTAGELTEPLGGAEPGEHTDYFGYGRIDALRAVRLALDGGEAPLVPVATPSLLSFDAGGEPRRFTLEGGEGLAVDKVQYSAGWLTVTPEEIDPTTKLGAYRVAVNAGSLLPGNYSSLVVATADNGVTTAVTVTLRVPAEATRPPDAGIHYLRLLTTDFTSVAQVMVGAENGKYQFELTAKVEPGDYYVVAGSDLDNDGIICTPGEACGAYPTADQPVLISLGPERREVNDLNFTTTFGTDLSEPADSAEQFGLLRKRYSTEPSP